MKKIKPTFFEIITIIVIILLVFGIWRQEIENAYENIVEVFTGVEYIDSETYSKIEKEIDRLENKVFVLEKRIEEFSKK